MRTRLYLCLLIALPTLLLATVGLARAIPYPWLLSETAVSTEGSEVPTNVPPESTGEATSTGSSTSLDTIIDAAPADSSSSTAATATDAGPDLTWLEERQQDRTLPKSAILPVLMYHHVAPIDYSKANALEADLTVLPSEFEKQLDYLRTRGYSTISLRELWNYFQGGKPLPPKAVVLTFDDGYSDVYGYAYPLLLRYGLRGTFFIITGLLGPPRYMSMDQVADMFRAGMEIGAHSSSHPSLPGLPAARLVQELVWPKKWLEEVTGASVMALAYPNGAYSPAIMAAARDAGYRVAVTTKPGATQLADRLMEMVRVRVHGGESVTTFRQQLERYVPSQP